LLGDFREDIFKAAVGNVDIHDISNDNGVRIVIFAISKYLNTKNALFPYPLIYLNIS
jgi:hypothetical protein